MATIAIAGTVLQVPTLRSFSSGSQLCSFCVADRAYVRPRKGEEEAPRQFYDVEVWGSFAALCVDRLCKGSRVAISGQAVWQGYTNASGDARKALRVINPSITFLDSKAEQQALAGATSTAQGSGVAHTASSGVGAPF